MTTVSVYSDNTNPIAGTAGHKSRGRLKQRATLIILMNTRRRSSLANVCEAALATIPENMRRRHSVAAQQTLDVRRSRLTQQTTVDDEEIISRQTSRLKRAVSQNAEDRDGLDNSAVDPIYALLKHATDMRKTSQTTAPNIAKSPDASSVKSPEEYTGAHRPSIYSDYTIGQSKSQGQPKPPPPLAQTKSPAIQKTKSVQSQEERSKDSKPSRKISAPVPPMTKLTSTSAKDKRRSSMSQPSNSIESYGSSIPEDPSTPEDSTPAAKPSFYECRPPLTPQMELRVPRKDSHMSTRSVEREPLSDSPVHGRRLRRFLPAMQSCDGLLQGGHQGRRDANVRSVAFTPAVKQEAPRHAVVRPYKSTYPEELNLNIGETVLVLESSDEIWWQGSKLDGMTGLFSADCVALLRPNESVAMLLFDVDIPLRSGATLHLCKDQIIFMVRPRQSVMPESIWIRTEDNMTVRCTAGAVRVLQKLLQAVCMTACDLIASAKPWEVQRETVNVIFEEFYEQGDAERENGREPIAMMDRHKGGELPSMQVGFMSGICLPCYKTLSGVLPNTNALVEKCSENLKQWQLLADQQKANDSDKAIDK